MSLSNEEVLKELQNNNRLLAEILAILKGFIQSGSSLL